MASEAAAAVTGLAHFVAAVFMFLVSPAGLALIALAFAGWLVHRVMISKHALARHRAWAMRHRISARLRPGPGFATVAELWFHWSKLAALSHGHRARPGLRLWERLASPATAYAVRFGRAQYGRQAYGRMQDQVLILAPPQSGKSGMLADRIIDHPGPVVCTSTRADLFTNTAGPRSRRGPVATFNPLGIGGICSTFGWNIIDGCAAPDTAIRRAQDLTGDYPTGDMKWWQCKASAALAALLHAAGLLPGATILDVHAWVHRHGDKMAEEILAASPAASRALRSILTSSERDALAPGSQGWWDDNCILRPWGFDLADITVPVLLLHGRQDMFVPFGHGEWLAAHIPGVEARLLDDDGHLTLLQNRVPEVHAWLSEHL